MDLRGRAVLGLDDRGRRGHPGLEIPALVVGGVAHEALVAQRGVEIDLERQLRPLRRERRQARLGGGLVVGRERGHGVPRVLGLGGEDRAAPLVRAAIRAEHRAHAVHGARGLEVELHGRVGVRGAQHGADEHPRQDDVDDVARRAADALGTRAPRGRLAHDGQVGVLLPELRLVLDEHPALLEAPLHLDRRLAQARLAHAAPFPAARRTARSILT